MLYADIIIILAFLGIGIVGAAGSLWAIIESAKSFKVFTSHPAGAPRARTDQPSR
jgi:hypothetical protein